MASLKVTLFGGLEARLASGDPVGLSSKKAQALLAYLAIRPGQSHQREKLAALLWGEKSDSHARNGVRHALVALRRGLAGSPSLRVEGQSLALDPASVDVDVPAFERLIADGSRLALEGAAEIYQGDLLLGFVVDEALFEEWLVAERERLREMALEALARLLAHQTVDAPERAIHTAVRLLTLDPLQETVHRALMRLYSRQGRLGAALKQYQVCVGALQRELGTSPEPETKQLYQELLRRPTKSGADPGVGAAKRAADGGTAPPDLPTAETPLFGRDEDLGRLRHLLDQALGGQGRVATVVGEAGIGKTQLVGALAAEALSRECRVLVGRCHESDSVLPFGPWVDALRSARVSQDEELLGALHPTRRAELCRLLPEAGVAGLPRAGATSLPLFESIAALLEGLAVRQPLVLVLEDLHWADEMSLRLLAFVSRRVSAWAALVLTTAREEELAGAPAAQRTLAGLARGAQAALLSLSPLSRPETALLVRALTRVGSDAPTLARLEERIWIMSEGNPFVAVEAMRSLDQASPTDVREQSALPALPPNVRDLVARRLDQLDPRGQQLAAVAAVIGRQFDFSLLRRASGMEERDAAEAVEEMVRSHVLQATGNELDFTHDRVREVAYDRLLAHRRKLLHRAVAEALEAEGAERLTDRSSDRIEQVAHHALRAEAWAKAASYLRQAGVRAAARSALQEARALLTRALDALAKLAESRATLVEAFDIRLELRPVLAQLGEFGGVLKILREADALADRLNDDGRRSRVLAFLSNIHGRLHELDEAFACGTRALAIAERLGDLRLRILASSFLVQAHSYRGEYTELVELARANVAAIPAEWAHEFFGCSQPPAINSRGWLLMGLAHLGRFPEAAGHTAELMELAESTHNAYTIGVACHATAVSHLLKGEWAKALSRLERWIDVLRAGNISSELPMALAYSARALAYLGEADESLRRIQESESLAEGQSAGGMRPNGWIDHALGRACLLLDRIGDAERLATRAVQSSLQRLDFVATVHHLLGDIAAHPERFDAGRAQAHYRKALGVAESHHLRPLVAHCRLGLGRLHAGTGDRQDARASLVAAASMYREMDMRFWLDEAESALAGARAPVPATS